MHVGRLFTIQIKHSSITIVLCQLHKWDMGRCYHRRLTLHKLCTLVNIMVSLQVKVICCTNLRPGCVALLGLPFVETSMVVQQCTYHIVARITVCICTGR